MFSYVSAEEELAQASKGNEKDGKGKKPGKDKKGEVSEVGGFLIVETKLLKTVKFGIFSDCFEVL